MLEGRLQSIRVIFMEYQRPAAMAKQPWAECWRNGKPQLRAA